MARWHPADAAYEAAELFRKRCLVDGTSLLWPEHRSWTVESIDALLKAISDDPEEGTFLEKMGNQLANQPDDVLRAAADVLAFYFLFPSSKSVGPKRKQESIQTIVDWRPEVLAIAPDERAMLESAFAHGIGSTGQDYLTGRTAHLTFLLGIARGVLQGRANPYDVDSCRELISALGLQLNGRTQARHLLLHLLFPDQFERTLSEAQKTRMVAAFPEEAGGAQDLDEALANIRRTLSERMDWMDLDFYDPRIRPLRDSDEPAPVLSAARYWWVNQGATYEQERAGGFLWAPMKSKSGQTFRH